jgi:hypothetical protein
MILSANALTLTPTGNATTANATGNVVVNGSEIDFFERAWCGTYLPEGIGRYRWTLSGESVNFVKLAPDPCGDLSPAAWTRTP